MRVVLDTNIVISALWNPQGLEARVVAMAREGTLVAYVSESLWQEYEDVLSRRKFIGLREAASTLLAGLALSVTRIIPATTVTYSVDDDDNRVLECLEPAGAAYLITGNLRHFPKEWQGTRIVNAREFIDKTEAGAPEG